MDCYKSGDDGCLWAVNGFLYQVYKLGSITRAINVNRFSNYVELQRELVDMFNLECQLDQEHGWQLVFRDNEDDLLLVGDDPWEYVSLTPILLFFAPPSPEIHAGEIIFD